MNRQVRHAFLSRGGTVEELRVRKINTQVRNALLSRGGTSREEFWAEDKLEMHVRPEATVAG